VAFSSDVFIVLIIVMVAFAVVRWIERRLGHRIGENDIERYEEKIKQLQAEMATQKEIYEKRIRELERRVDFLVSELQKAGIRIRDLERIERATHTQHDPLPAKPLLIVCGPDLQLCDTDRQALRRAGVSFQRIVSASKASISAELRRRRQDSTLYPWLHVTAHADDAGIHLVDGVAAPEWWNEHLDGVKVVFLAACKTSTVADALAGLVTVVFVHEDIGNQDAGDFTYAFWRRMKEHGDPLQSYRQAVVEAPQIAEFTDIRTA
jgi:hypothetical protein